MYVLFVFAVAICLLYYKWSYGSDLAFGVCLFVMLGCLYLLSVREGGGGVGILERFGDDDKEVVQEEAVGRYPRVDFGAFSQMFRSPSRIADMIGPGLDYVVHAMKGDTSPPLDESPTAQEDMNENPIDSRLVTHLKERGINAYASPAVVDKYQDMNLVLSLVKRVLPNDYKDFMSKYTGAQA